MLLRSSQCGQHGKPCYFAHHGAGSMGSHVTSLITVRAAWEAVLLHSSRCGQHGKPCYFAHHGASSMGSCVTSLITVRAAWKLCYFAHHGAGSMGSRVTSLITVRAAWEAVSLRSEVHVFSLHLSARQYTFIYSIYQASWKMNSS